MKDKNNTLLKVTLTIIVIGLAVGAVFLGKYLSDIYIESRANNNTETVELEQNN